MTAVETELEKTTWWASKTERSRQAGLYRIVATTADGPATPPALSARLHDALSVDLMRPTQPAPRPAGTPLQPPPIESPDVLGELASLAPEAGEAGIVAALPVVRDQLVSDDETLAEHAAMAEVAIAAAGRRRGLSIDLADPQETARALREASSVSRSIIADWLDLDPDAPTLVALARTTPHHVTSGISRSLERWAERQTPDSRTEVLEGFLQADITAGEWIRPIAQHGIDDERLVTAAARRVEQAARSEDRRAAVDFIVATSPSGYRAQHRLAQLMLVLLSTGKKVDFELALRAADGLGTEHRSSAAVREALDEATQKYGFRIPHKSLEALARARIEPKQRNVAEAALNGFKSLFGRR